MRTRLWVRLLISYFFVIAVGMAVTYLTTRLLAPHLFDQNMHGRGPAAGQGMGQGPGPTLKAAFRSALNTALLVALAASAVAAGGAAAFVSHRIVRPITAVRDATRRVASGDYAVHVPVSRVPELAELAADVNTLATAIADTETRRTRLLGDVAHEMRTPLTALDGYVEGLIDGVFEPDQQTLSALSDELGRLHRLADDLGSLSRAEEQRLELQCRDIDLAEVARAAAKRLSAQFADSGITLRLMADEPVQVNVDVQRIEQVLTNLLGNAIAATPANGIVTVTVERQNARAAVTVADNGVGLAKDDLQHIFERFYRIPHDHRRTGGTGVGLTIARSIARAHGGELTAASAGLGAGAQFTLTLPVG